MNDACADALLQVEELRVSYPSSGSGRPVRAVDGVTLSIRKGETLGLVGESGCGKSTLARAVMGLIRPQSGHIVFDGRDLLTLSAGELRRSRLDYQMVFQDPFASLDPGMNVGQIIEEAVSRRDGMDRDERMRATAILLEEVGLPTECMDRHPHEFSGGQRQRVAIARALATRPKLLVADEAVSALDVSVQSQILNLLMKLRHEHNLTMLFISHDLSVVRHVADRIAVMYLGKIVEMGPAAELMGRPLHMYTKALISAAPLPDPVLQKERARILLRGDPPSPSAPPPGCAFAWRSPVKVPNEVASRPGILCEAHPGHWVEVHPATVDDPALLALWDGQ